MFYHYFEVECLLHMVMDNILFYFLILGRDVIYIFPFFVVIISLLLTQRLKQILGKYYDGAFLLLCSTL